jgi:hypothetical protein
LTAALRIDDEEEETTGEAAPAADLSRFKDATFNDFVAGDVGKTIIVEGSGSGNNGQYIIQSIVSTDVVEVVPDFAANEAALRWKLRDIPAIGYVVLMVYRVNNPERFGGEVDYKLYSSNDYGENWTEVKHIDNIHDKSVNDSLDQDNCFFNLSELGQRLSYQANVGNYMAGSVIFRLTDVSEDNRRRQYWKIFKDRIGTQNNEFDVASMLLYDENFNLLGAASTNKIADADDSLFSACMAGRPMLVPYESSTTGQPSGTGTFTDTISAASESFYETTETTGEVLAGGTNFRDTTYAQFSHRDVGKYIRIDESGYADNGFHVITSIVSKSEVVTGSTGLTVQANLDWQLLAFGPGDYVRFESDTLFVHREGVELEDVYYEINDVPSNTTIELVNEELPVQIAGSSWSANFDINRDPDNTATHTQDAGFDTGNYIATSPRFGTIFYSTAIEFVEIESGTAATATKEWGGGAVDNDGDGRVNAVNINTTLTGVDGAFNTVSSGTGGDARFNTTAAHGLTVGDPVIIYGGTEYDGRYPVTVISVGPDWFEVDVAFNLTAAGSFSSWIGPGDYILMTGSASYGRRVLEIRDISRSGGTTDVRFTYDELLPSDTFTNWYVYTRRPWLKAAHRRTITVLNETP